MLVTKLLTKNDVERFKLECDQKRDDAFRERAGWFNQSGQMIGWGDLSLTDLQFISDNLREGEQFIVIKFHDFRGIRTSVLGPAELVAKAAFILIRGEIFEIDHDDKATRRVHDIKGVFFRYLTPWDAADLIAG